MAEPLPAVLADAAAAPAAIGLAELQARAALTTRTDRKYVVAEETAARLVDALATDHRVLAIDGRRSHVYRSHYFDSASLGAFRAHVQGRRRRYKCRTRHYVESDLYAFEVKLKGLRGETVKHQLPCTGADYACFGDEARAFAGRVLGETYGAAPGALLPALETEYRRVTLAADDGSSRVTVDVGLTFGGDNDAAAPRLRDGFAIVETKTGGRAGRADAVLAGLGARPVACSKYCVGIALLRDDVTDNLFRWVLRRYFAPGAAPAALPRAAGA